MKEKKLWICKQAGTCTEGCKEKVPHKKNPNCSMVGSLCFGECVPYVDKQEGMIKTLTAEEIQKKIPDLCKHCKNYGGFCFSRFGSIFEQAMGIVGYLLKLLGVGNYTLFIYVRGCERFESKIKGKK